MKVAISTLPLSTEHRMRGTGVYTKNLIGALQKYEKNHSYSFFTRTQDIPKDVDIVHYPFFDPFFLTLPLIKSHPTVVTVHDLTPLVFSDKFPAGFRGSIRWQIQRLSLRGARAVITDSQCSRKDIEHLVGVKRMYVVPLAPSPGFNSKREKTVNSIRDRYHLPEEYVLYIGDVNWNKNIPGLIDVWKIVKGKLPKTRDIKLVLAGSAFTDTEIKETRDLLHRIETLGLAKHIVRPGFIKDEDMAAIYQTSSFVVLPSWYEGFGLPVLEAMACGVPVVATDRGSVPEISGPAISADPENIEAFADDMLTMITISEDQKTELVKKGFAWASRFTWARVARETVGVYAKVINHNTNI